MRFFIPHVEDREHAERLYDAIRKWAGEATGNRVLDRRIYSIFWRHEGRRYESTVGQPDGRLGEKVIAILEGEVTYLVCTQNRGVAGGTPMLVGKDGVVLVTDFEQN